MRPPAPAKGAGRSRRTRRPQRWISCPWKDNKLAAQPVPQLSGAHQPRVGRGADVFQNAETDTPTRSLTTSVNGQSFYINTTRTDGARFDTSAFAPPTGVRFGNIGRNQFYGPGGWNLDFSVFRVFPYGGSRKLETRFEAANVMNNEVFGNPNGNVTSGTFGQITGINGNYPERMGRVAVRFTF